MAVRMRQPRNTRCMVVELFFSSRTRFLMRTVRSRLVFMAIPCVMGASSRLTCRISRSRCLTMTTASWTRSLSSSIRASPSASCSANRTLRYSVRNRCGVPLSRVVSQYLLVTVIMVSSSSRSESVSKMPASSSCFSLASSDSKRAFSSSKNFSRAYSGRAISSRRLSWKATSHRSRPLCPRKMRHIVTAANSRCLSSSMRALRSLALSRPILPRHMRWISLAARNSFWRRSRMERASEVR
mmetsp:Transcript_24667/g.55563  ORF Transcript_24667/g.55563 Transcript_24667/m.55563 type:complete len:241 (+) Transcript_24667:669-1391(+)